jgi:hypothetical protein
MVESYGMDARKNSPTFYERSTPEDPVPLFEVCGLFFFAVYKGYYILTSRQQAGVFGTKLASKVNNTMNNNATGWTIGRVQAPFAAHHGNPAFK